MAVEIGIGVFPDLLEKLLIIDRTGEIDPGIILKMERLQQTIVEFPVGRRDDGKIPLRIRGHELPDHGLEVVLGHKSSHHKVILFSPQTVRFKPFFVFDVRFARCRRLDLRSVCDESGLGMVFPIGLPDIFLNILAVADQKVRAAHHQSF